MAIMGSPSAYPSFPQTNTWMPVESESFGTDVCGRETLTNEIPWKTVTEDLIGPAQEAYRVRVVRVHWIKVYVQSYSSVAVHQ